MGGAATARAQDPAGTPQGAALAAIVPPEAGPEQPLPFSHKQHTQVAKAACADCHTPTKTGASLTMPQASTCMLCHSAIATDKPSIQKLTAISKSGEPIAWVRVYQVPSFVSFSHKLHMDKGNTCAECHGPVGTRDVISKETDISMGGCIACHTKKAAATTCDTCHQLESVRNHVPQIGPDQMLMARLGLIPGHPRAGSVPASPLSQYLGDLVPTASIGNLAVLLHAPSL